MIAAECRLQVARRISGLPRRRISPFFPVATRIMPAPPADESVRVIFLDVDGVVCCNDRGLLEPVKMMLLAKVCQETGAKVCLSTNWRLHDDLRNRLYTELSLIHISEPTRPY